MSNGEAKWPREKKLFTVEWKQVKENLVNNLEPRWMALRAAAGFLSRRQIYLLTTSSHFVFHKPSIQHVSNPLKWSIFTIKHPFTAPF